MFAVRASTRPVVAKVRKGQRGTVNGQPPQKNWGLGPPPRPSSPPRRQIWPPLPPSTPPRARAATRSTLLGRRIGAPPANRHCTRAPRAHPLSSPPSPIPPQPAPASKPAPLAKAAAVFAATVLLVTPVFSADAADLKSTVCARTPTAKICLRDSAKQ